MKGYILSQLAKLLGEKSWSLDEKKVQNSVEFQPLLMRHKPLYIRI